MKPHMNTWTHMGINIDLCRVTLRQRTTNSKVRSIGRITNQRAISRKLVNRVVLGRIIPKVISYDFSDFDGVIEIMIQS